MSSLIFESCVLAAVFYRGIAPNVIRLMITRYRNELDQKPNNSQ